jgi:hypothetical protein
LSDHSDVAEPEDRHDGATPAYAGWSVSGIAFLLAGLLTLGPALWLGRLLWVITAICWFISTTSPVRVTITPDLLTAWFFWGRGSHPSHSAATKSLWMPDVTIAGLFR